MAVPIPLVEAELNGSWVNITRYTLPGGKRGSPVTASSGRQTELATSEPGRAELSLINDDHRFTEGNATSPYYPYWTSGIRIRISEILDGALYRRMTGFLEMPQLTIQTYGVDQVVSASVVDRLTRLANSKVFDTLLAEHILSQGGTALKGYWSLTDAASPFPDLTGQQQPFRPQLYSTGASSSGAPVVSARQGSGLAGGEGLAVKLTPSTDSSTAFASGQRLVASDLSISLSAGQTLTAVVYHERSVVSSGSVDPIVMTLATSAGDTIQVSYSLVNSGLTATLSLAPSLACTRFTRDITGVTPIMLQFGYTPNSYVMYIGRDTYTGTVTGSAPAGPITITSITLGKAIPSGSWSHMQVYVGASTAWTSTTYLAQVRIAYDALGGQTCSERMATLAGYRGLVAGDYDFDVCDTQMQAADFSGQKLTDLWAKAVVTDGGLMFVNPDGVIRYQTRTRRYYP